MHDDAKALVRESANQAWAKLEFARLTFGAAGSAPGRMDTPELRRVVDGMFARAKSEITWGATPDTLEKSAARVLMNLVLLAVEALPRGGVVEIEISPDGSTLNLKAEGRRARLTPAVAAGLEGRQPEDGFDARNIQAYYAGLLTREAGGRIWGKADGERIELGAELGDPARLAKAG
jgi:histidine phosphotransferase ChpT